MVNILKNTAKGKLNVDSDSHIEIELEENNRIIPVSDISGVIDEYDQYVKEKDECNTYSLIFTVNVVASNVLFNKVSEIVYKEGSDDCVYFSELKGPQGNVSSLEETGVNDYKNYKSLGDDFVLNRYELIRDTSYSDSNIGPLVYHCGYDIFGNHLLRNKYFVIINKLPDETKVNPENFNTLSDLLRRYNGSDVNDYVNTIKMSDDSRFENKTDMSKLHQYTYETIYSISETISHRLVENNGWFGFINPTGLNISNYNNGEKDIPLIKCMNNNKGCEQIDMYPDRELFSMVPKYNKYRHRIENNWDFCLTYPFSSYTDNVLVQEVVDGDTINGIVCELLNKPKELFTTTYITGTSIEVINNGVVDKSKLLEDDDPEFLDTVDLTFRCYIPHGLSPDDTIKLYKIFDGKYQELGETPVITGIGNTGYYDEYVFKISSSFLDTYLTLDDIETETVTDEDDKVTGYKYSWKNGLRFRFRKYKNSAECKYYFRLFRRIPNFKDSNVYSDGKLSEIEIEDSVLKDFNVNVNNLAFSKNAYGDDTSQILYNDDVNLKSFRDNLGRELSEVYLTFIKTNKGNEEWYKNHNYTSSDVEFSHCFGKLTAGIDMPSYTETYNVHKIHNVNLDNIKTTLGKLIIDKNNNDLGINLIDTYHTDSIYQMLKKITTIDESPLNLENNDGEINISGDTYLKAIFEDGILKDGDGIFWGDIVEYSPNDAEETVLTDVKYRFNTYQREYTDDFEFFNFNYEEIDEDDFGIFDINNGSTEFSAQKHVYNKYSSDETDNIMDTRKGYGKLKTYCPYYPFNIEPEGYYYSPHHIIKLKERSNTVKTGYHERMNFEVTLASGDSKTFDIIASKNYYMGPQDKIVAYRKDDNTERGYVEGIVTTVSGTNFTYLRIRFESEIDDIDNYRVFKYNIEKPEGAQESYDGSGRYNWRNMKTETDYTKDDELYDRLFTNGRIYIHDNINLYVMRQDSYGYYGLMFIDDKCPAKVKNLEISGEYKDVSQYEEEETDDAVICGINVSDSLKKATDSINANTIVEKTSDLLNI